VYYIAHGEKFLDEALLQETAPNRGRSLASAIALFSAGEERAK